MPVLHVLRHPEATASEHRSYAFLHLLDTAMGRRIGTEMTGEKMT